MAAKTFLTTTLTISLFLIVLAFSTTAHAKIIYVDDAAAGANDGSSWTDAYQYLGYALDNASSGDDIHVAQGIYRPSEGYGAIPEFDWRTSTFWLKNGVILDGGYAGSGEPDPNTRDIDAYETILSGDLYGDDGPNFANNAENSYHVVTGSDMDATAVLDGFTITGGNANGSSYPNNRGGGIYNLDSSLTLADCTFIENSAKYYGGGMYNDNSSPMITSCIFSSNSASWGGGMYNTKSNPTVTNCSFRNNSATGSGGGILNRYDSSPTVKFCAFNHNSAVWGGGMCNSDYSSPTIVNCIFNDNSAKYYGGGMYNESYSSPAVKSCTFSSNSVEDGGGMSNCNNSSPTITNCTFNNNSAKYDGGGMYNWNSSPVAENCTFTTNSASSGGGVYNEDSNPTLKGCIFSSNSASYGGGMNNSNSSPKLNNCTFSGNRASDRGGGIFSYWYSRPMANNCILWADVPSEISGDKPIVATYSNVQGGYYGKGNINADPCFVNPDSNDYHLLPDSPCIDAGYPNYVANPNETDLDGNPRVINCRVDMGAYEYGQLVPAKARIVPRTINLASKGNWITAYIWLPKEYNVADIDSDSILLDCEIEPVSLHVDEQAQLVTTKFTREDVQPILEIGDIELKITGLLIDGTWFEATDTIKVVDKAEKN